MAGRCAPVTCDALPVITTLATGAKTSGCLVFQVPKDSKITRVRFVLDSGDSPQTGLWKVS